ncbi:autotransporter assembly complex protein TamA [Parvularcula lutaonensis]|uniref:Autotransporter assembly complex family protein n=1 Tax=Parvularcula lutaonensis TaxID=491923 RepID=A0ABV7M713_9PROT|nr:BamA/TamA family outer membrane protein [Parvularcula lutaonensis]GGY41017.1 outer membrane protein assembly factor [Parvularcula lutaonensis]
MILYRLTLLALVFVLASALPGAASAQGLEVKVTIEGLEKALQKELRPLSSLARKPESFSALAPIRRAANADAEALRAALQSKGYYAALVEPTVDREGSVVNVTFRIEPGKRFRITGYEIDYLDEQPAERIETLEEAGISPDGSPTGEALQEIEARLLDHYWDAGFLGAEIRHREVLSDFSEGTGVARFRVRTGPKASYGEIRVEGLERTDPDFIRQFRTFETGETAQRSELDTFRERLIETSLFNEVDVQPQLPAEDGTTDILVRLRERPHRTLGGGVSYATDVGPGANAFWENRNLLRRGETLRAEIIASAPVQEGSLSFRKRRPRLPGYYTFATVLRNEDTDAFNAQTVEVGGALAKLWMDRNLTTEGGVRLQYSDITEKDCILPSGVPIDVGEEQTCEGRGGTRRGRQRTFQAVSVPMSVLWNSQKEPLDPQDGWAAGLVVTPFFGTVDFQRITLSYTDRVFWGRRDGGTLAGRMKIGAIYGAGRGSIPATERFYAGGGGSLRGFAFQEASPIDRLTGEILGGASLGEFNIELRQHVTEAIELAVFSDIGGAFEDNTPSFDQVLVGAGVGVRYHTAIGPVRVDVAVPVNRRRFTIADTIRDENTDPDVVFEDSAFEIYIGLGQPF